MNPGGSQHDTTAHDKNIIKVKIKDHFLVFSMISKHLSPRYLIIRSMLE